MMRRSSFCEERNGTGLRLSDSIGLSDNLRCYRSLVVRFFMFIGQAAMAPVSGCPIHSDYRTSCDGTGFWLSDFSCLSDNLRRSAPGRRSPVIISRTSDEAALIGEPKLKCWLNSGEASARRNRAENCS
ncbi:hypothetical protein C8U37_10395 [Trichococcus patagoniensis]|uniref:Uncharacterized protein n=1 Tax=Trichococcus patagoniensis TaxID=382641 RepID=A0A2T5IPJ2_9LACT|nr:hypothetical protein C8U37_10395 [Trichococcus patagoniensis]